MAGAPLCCTATAPRASPPASYSVHLAPRTAHLAPPASTPYVFTGQVRHGRRYRCHRGRSGGHCASLGGCDGPGWLGRGRRHGGRRGRGGRIQGGPHQHPLTHWGGTELEFELSQAGRQRACRLGTGRACVHAERGERGSAHDTAQMNVYSDASDSIVRTRPRVCACGRLRAPGSACASRWVVGTIVAVLL